LGWACFHPYSFDLDGCFDFTEEIEPRGVGRRTEKSGKYKMEGFFSSWAPTTILGPTPHASEALHGCSLDFFLKNINSAKQYSSPIFKFCGNSTSPSGWTVKTNRPDNMWLGRGLFFFPARERVWNLKK
jgi:hypothetical protein